MTQIIINHISDIYQNIAYDLADSRTKYMWILHPLTPTVIIIAYLLTIKKILPNYMKTRKAYDLKNTIVFYNFIQILMNSYIFIECFPHIFGRSFTCYEVDLEIEITYSCFGVLYVYNKWLDLLDTVFFVLRKKDNQVSFLHVYHHVLMIIITFISGRYFPGGHTGYQLFFNVLVHIVMYFYYLLTAWDEKYKKSVWWKKYLTQIQMVQFVLCFLLYLGPVFSSNCKFNKYFSMLAVSQNSIIFALFANFYYKAYIVKKKK